MALLRLSECSLSFGGLTAVSNFHGAIDRGELVGLIGPNGAGKTTVFNLVTGLYRPSRGAIELDGARIDGLPPYAINRRGIARTFQNIRLFPQLTVLENIQVGCLRQVESRLLAPLLRSSRFVRAETALEDHCLDLLRGFGLEAQADLPARNLAYGPQRRLEIARALATQPRLLLLDEPAAGMNPQEKIELAGLIGRIRDEFDVAIWIIEHDMKLMMQICQRITVLDHGEIIAEGRPGVIQRDPRVIEAYLGEPPGRRPPP